MGIWKGAHGVCGEIGIFYCLLKRFGFDGRGLKF